MAHQPGSHNILIQNVFSWAWHSVLSLPFFGRMTKSLCRNELFFCRFSNAQMLSFPNFVLITIVIELGIYGNRIAPYPEM